MTDRVGGTGTTQPGLCSRFGPRIIPSEVHVPPRQGVGGHEAREVFEKEMPG